MTPRRPQYCLLIGLLLVTSTLGTTLPWFTNAQIGDGFDRVFGTKPTDGPVAGFAGIRQLLGRVINGLLILLAVVAFGAIVYGGFLYIAALGNDERTQRAKRILMFSIIGIIVITLSAMLVNATLALLAP